MQTFQNKWLIGHGPLSHTDSLYTKAQCADVNKTSWPVLTTIIIQNLRNRKQTNPHLYKLNRILINK